MGIFRKRSKGSVIVDDVLLTALLEKGSLTREQALSVTGVSGCVDLICNIFAMIPFKLYEQVKIDGKTVVREVEDNRVRIINDETGDTLDGFQFKKAMCEDYLLGKGGYAYIKKTGNKFIGLFYVKDKDISINMNCDPIFKNYDICVWAYKYHDFEFLKLLRNTKDGASGVGLAEEISTALMTAYKRLLYEYDLTVTGGSRKGFIQSDKQLSQQAIDALKKAWNEYYAGNANTVILNNGLKFQEASNTSRENEINEKERAFSEEIKSIFHIGKTYEETVKMAIMPIVTAFTTALNRDFLLESEKESFYFAPDTKELYRGSLKERYEAYQIAIKNGFKTRNEIRYLEDDNAIKGLDCISFTLADVLLDTNTGNIYTPNTNKAVNVESEATEGGDLSEN